MDEIIPVSSLVPVNAVQAFAQAKITPYRVTHIHNTKEILYEFHKPIDPKVKYLARTTKREIAMITISGDIKRFKISYYSVDNGTQIVQDLEIEKLREMVNELKAAGFN